MQIGIDPQGGTNFYASSVAFSKGTSVYDSWKEFVVEATASGSQVTVFIMYHPDYPVERNRVVWDAASLIVGGGGGSVTTVTPQPTSEPAATQAAISSSGTTTGQSAVTYTVKSGDTLSRIARANGTTTSTIINLNGPTYPSLYTNPNLIYVGWVLKLSSGAAGGTSSGSTPTSSRTYVVKAGDYVTKIARENGTTSSQIISLNSATYPTLTSNPNLIHVGWVLKLP
jgi:LysM repeat protein